MAYKVRMKKNWNIGKVVAKLISVILALWVGGEIVNAVGDVINGTTSPFYQGLTLIGWTVSNGTVTDTSGSGILTVIGIIGIASIVTEFVEFNMGN